MEKEWWATGRDAFPLLLDSKEYSGRDFHNVFLAGSGGLSHSFFNGATIADAAFDNVQFDHVELAEALVTRTTFARANLEASDLVRSRIEDTHFRSCNFANGDWRNSTFTNSTFTDCSFSHTTINLCTFNMCKFLGLSAHGLDHHSVNYNTFTQCEFDAEITDGLVASRNFGLPVPAGANNAISSRAAASLEELCILSGTGIIRAIDLVTAIEKELSQPQIRLKQSRLEFLSKIVSALSSQRRLSPSTLIYIEGLFIDLAKNATNEVDFLAAMAALVNLRNSLFEAATRGPQGKLQDPNATCDSLIVRFKERFAAADASVLAEVLSEVIFGRPADVVVTSVKYGSTIIEFVFTTATTVASVIAALNLVLTQATIFLGKLEKARRAAQKLRSGRQISLAAARPRKTSRVAAIVNSDQELPQLLPIRKAVRKTGNILIKMDEPAEIDLTRLGSMR